jgi:hypothetical protein
MADGAWLRVPVGPETGRWATRTGCRTVLLVVHNVTAATRLLDVLPLFDGDLRVQVLTTCTGSSPFQDGVPELLAGTGRPVLPWEQAKATPVDLAISASYGGELHCLRGPLAVLSHGVGYNKRLAAPGAGPDGEDPVFGLAPEWLLHEGRPVATATVLSHPEQLGRLRAACPQAAPTAVLAGDPCYDRMLAAARHRERFRRAFGVGPGQRLVVLTSTWNPRSLLGDADDVLPDLLRRLMTELPIDEYRALVVLHPNIVHAHGRGQVRAWFEPLRRAGLTLVPPLDGWRQALVAADCVIGDHGSVTFYAAALGVPVLLGAFPDADLDPCSPVAGLGRLAPRLVPGRRLRPQLDRVMTEHTPGRYAELTAQTSSSPGQAAALLRGLFYGLVGLPEPGRRAGLDPLRAPRPGERRTTAPVRVLTRALGAAEVGVARYLDTGAGPADGAGDAHTAVHEDTAEPDRLALADVVVQHAHPDHDPPAVWTAEALAAHPDAAMAVYVTGRDRCTVRTADGTLLELTAGPGPDGRPDGCDPAVHASALHAWLAGGGSVGELAAGLTVRTGSAAHHVRVARVGG